MSNKNRFKKTQIEDGEYILTAKEYASIMRLVKASENGSALSLALISGLFIDKDSNQTISGSKTFKDPVSVADATNDTHAVNIKTVRDLIDNYPLFKFKGVFGEGKDLPLNPKENLSLYIAKHSVNTSVYSHTIKQHFNVNDFALYLHGEWFKLVNTSGIISINGKTDQDLSFSLSDLKDVDVLSVNDIGKVIRIKKSGRGNAPSVGFDNIGHNQLFESCVELLSNTSILEIPFDHANWAQYEELHLIAQDIIGNYLCKAKDGAYRIGWGFKNINNSYIPIFNEYAEGTFLTCGPPLTNLGKQTSSLTLRLSTNGNKLSVTTYASALVTSASKNGRILKTGFIGPNPKVSSNEDKLFPSGNFNACTFINAPLKDITKIIFKISKDLVPHVNTFEGTVRIKGIK